jgi:hypothetical protein
MKEYVIRMQAEEKELNYRISKAVKALQNPPYGIDDMGLHLLSKQIDAMKVYSDVLHQRIEYEGKKNG